MNLLCEGCDLFQTEVSSTLSVSNFFFLFSGPPKLNSFYISPWCCGFWQASQADRQTRRPGDKKNLPGVGWQQPQLCRLRRPPQPRWRLSVQHVTQLLNFFRQVSGGNSKKRKLEKISPRPSKQPPRLFEAAFFFLRWFPLGHQVSTNFYSRASRACKFGVVMPPFSMHSSAWPNIEIEKKSSYN